MRGDSLHIHHPHGESDRVTDTQPQYDGTHPQVLVLTTIEEQDTQQDAHSYPNITQTTERTVIHSRIPPAASDHSYLDQAQADEQHHDTRYQGSNHRAQIFKSTAHDHLYRRGGDTNAENKGKPSRQASRDNRADKREASSLDT